MIDTSDFSTSMAWFLYAMCSNPEIQKRLRAEVFSLNSDSPTMDELNSLKYLDGVVRETLRLFSVVPLLQRVADQDDVIPLTKPYVDSKGVSHKEIL